MASSMVDIQSIEHLDWQWLLDIRDGTDPSEWPIEALRNAAQKKLQKVRPDKVDDDNDDTTMYIRGYYSTLCQWLETQPNSNAFWGHRPSQREVLRVKEQRAQKKAYAYRSKGEIMDKMRTLNEARKQCMYTRAIYCEQDDELHDKIISLKAQEARAREKLERYQTIVQKCQEEVQSHNATWQTLQTQVASDEARLSELQGEISAADSAMAAVEQVLESLGCTSNVDEDSDDFRHL